MRRFAWVGALVLGASLMAAQRAEAVITKLTPLHEILAESQFIVSVKVDSIDPDKPALVLVVDEDLKEKAPFRRLPVNLKGDSSAEREKQTPQLLKRVAPKLPLILFVNQRGARFTAFAYTNGTWLQMIGQKGDDEAVRWGFTHLEPFLRRTYKGATADLRQIIIDGLANKKKPPEPDAKEPPGLGPEVKPEKQSRRPDAGSSLRASLFTLLAWSPGSLATLSTPRFIPTFDPPIAVIPTVLVGGPIAILAMLFPALFGGVLLLFHRWMAFFSVVATSSTIYFLHSWFAGSHIGAWWSSSVALWFSIMLVTLLGTLWASRRHAAAAVQGEDPPPRAEAVVLAVLSAVCLAGVGYGWLYPPPRYDAMWNLLMVFALAVWVGTLYKILRGIIGTTQTSMPMEAVMLWAALLAFTGLTAARPGVATLAGSADAAGEGRPTARLEKDGVWMRTLSQDKARGMIVSSPLVVDNRIYVAAAYEQGSLKYGVLYCLNRFTQEVLWTFDDPDMKRVFSSPRYADGRIFIGEGFHDDPDCRLYCLDARTGKPCWPPFQTRSQTESSPCPADGKVFFGAGNDGLYALDAATGKKLWQFPENPDQGRLLRICASPATADGRVYVGSGVDRTRPDDPGETAVFAVEASTGKLAWTTPVDLPSWAAPVVVGERVIFALGNGDVFEDAPKPAGAVLCVEAATGKQVWRVDLPNGVIEKPAVDGHRIYFGCRDGKCYCLSLLDGKELWTKALDSPVVSAVALDSCSHCGRTANLFVVSTRGGVHCLDPYTGNLHWSYGEVERHSAFVCSSPTVVVNHAAGYDRRHVYFGSALHNLTQPVLICVKDLLPDP